MMNEIKSKINNGYYKPIKGFECLYWISRDGEVVSKRLKINKHRLDKDGYRRIALYKGGKAHHFRTARLVAMNYVDNPEKKPCVNHIDGNKINDHYANLEWCTVIENNRHSWAIGNSKVSQNMIDAIKKRLRKKINQYDLNGNFIRSWDGIRVAAREGGYMSGRICKVLKGKMNKHGNSLWRYA